MAELSVIIPVYKVEAYLRQCLDSVVNQTFRDLEIILIDDGSPDNCGQICDEYAEKDDRIRVLHKQNAGLTAARNDGIDMATGTYLTFVDSDDWLELDYYEQLVEAMRKYDADLVTSNYYWVVEDCCTLRKSVTTERLVEDPDTIFSFQLGSLSIYFCKLKEPGLTGCWNKIFKRAFLLEHHLYFDAVQTYEDALFTFKVFRHARHVACVPVAGYYYRYVAASITHGYNPKRIDQDKNSIDTLYRLGAEQFSPDSSAWGALYAFTVAGLRTTVWNGLFGKANPMTLREKLKTLKKILESEPYRTALAKVNPRALKSKRMRPCTVFKTHSAPYLYALCLLQSWKRKLFGVRKH